MLEFMMEVLNIKKTFLWVLPITTTITDRTFDSPNNVLFQDDFPGGVSPFGGDLENDNGSANSLFGGFGFNFMIEPNFNFISTVSALDIGSGNTTLTDAIYRDVYTAASPPSGALSSPFVNFTTSFSNNGNNEPHITFNRANGDWLAAEINPIVVPEIFDCSVSCEALEIEGSDYLCNQDTYYLDIDPGSISGVTWSVSNTNALTIVSPNDISTVLQASSGVRATVTLTATITINPRCGGGTAVVSREIRVGKPQIPDFLNGPSEVLTGALVTYTAGPSEGATAYKWRLPHPFLNVPQYDYYGSQWQVRNPGNFRIQQVFSGTGGINGLVQVAGTNPCGEGGSQMMNVTHSTNGQGGQTVAPPSEDDGTTRTAAYPNPASSNVIVSLRDDLSTEKQARTLQSVTIYDRNRRAQNYSYISATATEINIDISSLRTDIYFIEVITDKGLEIKKLLVK